MALPDDDRDALAARLAPAGTGALDVIADAFDDGEELRELLVDVHGDVVAFTDRRALFIAKRSKTATAVGYESVQLRPRSSGLGIDALLEDGRLILDVARGTMARLAVVDTGAPPWRATWLPVRTPPPRPDPPPPAPTAAPGPAVPGAELPPPAPGIRPLPVAIRPPAPAPRSGPASGPVTAPAPLTGGARPTDLAPATADPSAPTTPPPAPSVPMPPATQPAGLPPAGWHPDPAGRHWWRWWDGLDWTEHVADGGSPFVDPLPPRA